MIFQRVRTLPALRRALPLFFLLGALPVAAAVPAPIDPDATAETRALFDNLRAVTGEHILFGHHHTTALGVNWSWEKNRSDVLTLVGDYPAVHSWDFRFIKDSLSAHDDEIVDQIVSAFERGAVLTMSWHMENPVGGGNYSDHTPAVAEILPDGSHHAELVERLDEFADFIGRLRDKDGRPVPVIFRPWHEHTGVSFWWGQSYCTKEEFIALWRFTVTHLRDTRGLHQLLWAYSPNRRASVAPAIYLERYPGDEWVDLLGLDFYSRNGDLALAKPTLKRVVEEAQKRGKIAAFTETGPHAGLGAHGTPTYFTGELLGVLRDPELRGLAYVLTWHNAGEKQYWVPQPGDPSAEDFKAFYADPFTWFERDLPDLYSPAK